MTAVMDVRRKGGRQSTLDMALEFCKRTVLKFVGRATAAVACCLIGACGGGGGGSATSQPPPNAIVNPSLSLTVVYPKTFRFDWADVSGETEYRLLENPTGSSGYTVVATLPAGSTRHELSVFLPSRAQARYIVQACDAVRCADSSPVFVSGTLAAAVGYLKASDAGTGDAFGAGGIALSLDGSTLAVGAPNEDGTTTGIDGDPDADGDLTYNSGAVYVFSRTATGWIQDAYIKASNAGAGVGREDKFGAALALSANGDTLAVGAWGEDSGASGVDGDPSNESSSDSGAVYVFSRVAGQWSQQAYVKASNTDVIDYFGYSLTLSADGDTLAVGAPSEDSSADGVDQGALGSGAVYVFSRAGGVWSQRAFLKASNAERFDDFGNAVALAADGQTLAVGARLEDSGADGVGGEQSDNSAPRSGAVYVFSRSGDGWMQQAYLKASNSHGFFSIALFDRGDQFGDAVAISADGNTLAVGASREQSGATGIDGNQLDDSADASGAVYVFTRAGAEWTQQAYLKASNTERGDEFGAALATTADGNTIAVGAHSEDASAVGLNGAQADNSAHSSGAVYVFTRELGVWSQLAYVKASQPSGGDNFGTSVALAPNGMTLAVGANDDDSFTATGVPQDDEAAFGSGAVYLY